MAIEIKELIEKLQNQPDQSKKVEFLVCDSDGGLVVAEIAEQSKNMKQLMQMFAD